MVLSQIVVEPLFRVHPREEGKCPLNGGWAGFCLIINQQTKYTFSFILPRNLLQSL